MARFVLLLEFKNEDDRLKARPAHREHLQALLEQGRLITAGPWADDKGAMHIYEVEDEAELREILDRDPYTAVDAYDIALLKEWTPILP
ncbi:YciI family protein [Nonomuraea sp. NPDC049309]|uniref:YciI family protein n=1 Tax=Nonomuraea sp. NPDC049309 TaxID=3364350 RepID=UPI0037191890